LNKIQMVISLDCHGGDNSPRAVIEGMIKYLKKNRNVKFLLFGDERILKKELKHYSGFEHYYSVIDCIKKIASDEKPSVALRRGKESTMGMAIESVKNKQADACISAGNTGALMALSKLILRPLSDIDRPALIQQLPTEYNKSVTFLDLGANVDCTSESLYQFAVMGKVFSEVLTDNREPKIGLLNIGTEDIKGNDTIKNASVMLKNSVLRDNYYGFIESSDIFKEKVDVIVTDGFTGNIALKTVEGTAKFIAKNIKKMFLHSIFSVFGFLFMIGGLLKLKKQISPENYNGALFIGLNGISVKSHGNANGRAFYCAIKNTVKLIKGNINEKIVEAMRENTDGEEESTVGGEEKQEQIK
jgi:glycerol-3-phosphate acyltransferase PlsX